MSVSQSIEEDLNDRECGLRKSWSVTTGASAAHKLGFSDILSNAGDLVDDEHPQPPQWRQAKIVRRKVSANPIIRGLWELRRAEYCLPISSLE